MARKIKLVVSDFHLGKGRFLKDGTVNILEDFNYGPKFVEFLRFYSQGEYETVETELVINGDFLNLLQTDYLGVHTSLVTDRITEYQVRSIIAGHVDVFDALRDFAEKPNHEIAYVIGNHDQAVLFSSARKILRECIGPGIRFYDTFYEFDGVRIEHGHQYEIVNRCDLQNFAISDPMYPEPVLNLPWASLFVSDYLPQIKKERPFVDKVKPFMSYVRWALIHDTAFAFRMGFYIALSFIRMAILQPKHPLLDVRLNWERLRGITFYPAFVSVAHRLLKKNPHLHTVIFGHTHVLRYKQWAGGREYFNIGTWNEVTSLEMGDFGLQCKLTYAHIEQVAPGKRPRTRLKEWKGHWETIVDATNMPGQQSAYSK